MPNEHRRLVDTANAPICCWPLCFHFELLEDTAPRFEPREEREIFILDMWCPRAKTATWSGSTTFNRPDPAVRVSTPSRLPSLPHPLLQVGGGGDLVDGGGGAGLAGAGLSSGPVGASRGLKMATGSGASSSTGSRGPSRQPPTGGQPLCPFCRTATIVERTSRTTNNPDKQFYTCKNRDWVSFLYFMLFIFVNANSRSRVHPKSLLEQGNSKCAFFMWKPVSDGVDAASLTAGVQALEKSLLALGNSVEAQSLHVSRIAGQQRVDRWLNVASVFVGVVCFVVLCSCLVHLNAEARLTL